jgi:hypothetical protein
MVGAAACDRLPIRRKPMAMWASACSRYLWIVLALLPLVAMAPRLKVTVFLSIFAVSSLMMQTAGLAWLDHHKAMGQEGWGFTTMLLFATLAAVGCRWTTAREVVPPAPASV